ncbi:MAG: hypothetical protein AB7O32_03435 [Vicinamibacterales bacterium]
MALVLACAACASPRNALTLRVAVAPDANDRTPIPVDVVFVWDKAVAGKVAPLTATAWFGTKAQFLQDDPKRQMLTVCEWEWVPGQVVPEINLAVPVAARRWIQGVFLFANYRTPGSHRAQVQFGTASALDLRRQDAAVTPLGKSTSPAFVWLDEACRTSPPGAAPQLARSSS